MTPPEAVHSCTNHNAATSSVDIDTALVDVEEEDKFEEETETAAAHEPKLQVAQGESRAVWYLRGSTFLILGTFALAVCLQIYFSYTKNEHESFERGFEDVRAKLVDSFDRTIQARFGIVEKFANDITAHASYAKETRNESWPFVTVPQFEVRHCSE